MSYSLRVVSLVDFIVAEKSFIKQVYLPEENMFALHVLNKSFLTTYKGLNKQNKPTV